MRSVVLGMAMLLSACQQRNAEPDVVTIDLPERNDASMPPPPSPPAPSPALKKAFQALGTEPFWSATVVDGKLTWSTPDDIPGVTVPADGGAEGRGWRYTATLKGEAFDLRIEQAPCSDGMSDTTYAYSARVAIGSRLLTGCARPK